MCTHNIWVSLVPGLRHSAYAVTDPWSPPVAVLGPSGPWGLWSSSSCWYSDLLSCSQASPAQRSLTPTHTQSGLRAHPHRLYLEVGFVENIGYTAVISHRVRPAYWPTPVYTWPASFIPFSLYFPMLLPPWFTFLPPYGPFPKHFTPSLTHCHNPLIKHPIMHFMKSQNALPPAALQPFRPWTLLVCRALRGESFPTDLSGWVSLQGQGFDHPPWMVLGSSQLSVLCSHCNWVPTLTIAPWMPSRSQCLSGEP